MPDKRLHNKPYAAGRPSLRCPACGGTVVLPAENCSHCRVNLRTGHVGVDKSASSLLVSSLKITLKIMAAIVLVASLAEVFKKDEQPRPDPARFSAEAMGRRDNFQIMAEEHPVLLKPYIYVYRARQAVGGLNEGLDRRQLMIEAAEKMAVDDSFQTDEQALEYSRKMSPRERARALKELTTIMSQGRDDGSPAYTGPTSPGQRRRMIEEIDRAPAN